MYTYRSCVHVYLSFLCTCIPIFVADMSFSEHLGKFAMTTSINGIQYAYESKSKLGKTFWILLIMAMFSCSCFLSFRVVQAYLDHPVYTTSYVTRAVHKLCHRLLFVVIEDCQRAGNYRNLSDRLPISESLVGITGIDGL